MFVRTHPLSALLSVLVILHIRMHHKDAKKADMLYRWVAYSFEANVRE